MTDHCTDNQQLVPMAAVAKAVLEQETLNATADADYSNGEQFQACEDAKISAFVPPNRAINNQGDEQQFERSVFTYDEQSDSYQCPGNKTLSLKQLNRGSRIYVANAQDCAHCPLKPQCPQARQCHLSRYAHEAAFERIEQRLKLYDEQALLHR